MPRGVGFNLFVPLMTGQDRVITFLFQEDAKTATSLLQALRLTSSVAYTSQFPTMVLAGLKMNFGLHAPLTVHRPHTRLDVIEKFP